jgi:sugar phosphate isomerase/epimerase
MRVGFLTACLRNVALPEVFRWAGEVGFSALEVWAVSAENEKSLHLGGALNASCVTKRSAAEVLGWAEESGARISCLTQCTNLWDADEGLRAELLNDFKQVIQAAAHLGVSTVSGFVGRHPKLTIAGNVDLFAKVFRPLLRYAAGRGVRIAIENCPMPGWQFEGLAGNIAYSPWVWDMLYERLPDDNFGLNFDPSHLYWLGVDYLAAVEDYADRIFHVHAKDTEIDEAALAHKGSLLGGGWWRYRIPGMGELDWAKFISRLYEMGYDGALSIEHEDPVWGGPEEKVKEGLVIGGRFLKQFVVAGPV